jgi:hypothetical protein
MARNFNGGTDSLVYQHSPTPLSQGCAAFWINTTQTTTNTSVLTYWSNTSRNGFGLLLNNTANKITGVGYDASAQRVNIASTTSVNSGAAFHVAFNYDRANGGANDLYINGSQEVTANSSAAWTTGVANFWVQAGDNLDAFWASYVGDMWEIGHWQGGKLTSGEIATLAAGYAPKLIRPDLLTLYAPLVRETRPVRINTTGTISATGTTVIDHPRIIGGSV